LILVFYKTEVRLIQFHSDKVRLKRAKSLKRSSKNKKNNDVNTVTCARERRWAEAMRRALPQTKVSPAPKVAKLV